jgi:small conductance mechanosensitive channel
VTFTKTPQWLDDHGQDLLTGGLRILLIVVLALVARMMLHRLIERVISGAVHGGRRLRERAKGTALDPSPLLSERRRARTDTLASVLRSIASFTVFAVAGSMILAELGLDLTPVIASAGVLGLAVGFGAQHLVRDVLAGMFMLLEDQYGVGDWIDAGAASGTVEAVSLRTTRLRDVDGTVWYVRNGEITRIGNTSQGWGRVLLDVPVSVDSDLAEVREIALDACRELLAEPDWAARVLSEPEIWGVQHVEAGRLLLRVVVTTVAGERIPVERALRERLITALTARGIHLGA